MTKRNLKKAIKQLDIVKKNRDIEFPGILGFLILGQQVVEVPGRPGYVYVRLRNNLSEVIQAYNDAVALVYGLPIVVVRDEIDKTRYKIKGKDLGVYQDWGSTSYVPRHGGQHSFSNEFWGGGDVVWIYSRQFMPLLVTPSGSSGAGNVIIQPYTFYRNNQWFYAGGTGTSSFLIYKPTGSNARMVLTYLDDNANPQLLAGSYFDASLTGSSQVYQYLPALPDTGAMPLAGIRLLSGTSIINWDNIYDLRPLVVGDGFIPTGTNYSGHVIQDDSVNKIQRNNLNFVGDNFVVYDDSGNDATIVSGTSVINNITNYSIPLLVYEDSVFKATGTSISFNNNLDVIASGTSVFVNATSSGGSGGGIVIYEDSVYKVTGSAISFNGDLSVAVTGSSAFVSVASSSGGMSVISEIICTGTTTNILTFSSIPSTYRALKIEVACRSSAASSTLSVRMNNDSNDANYRSDYIYSLTSTLSRDGADLGLLGQMPGSTSPAGCVAFGTFELYNYAGTFRKMCIGHLAYRADVSTSYIYQFISSVEWENRAAITRLDFVDNSGNFVSGSSITVYGIT